MNKAFTSFFAIGLCLNLAHAQSNSNAGFMKFNTQKMDSIDMIYKNPAGYLYFTPKAQINKQEANTALIRGLRINLKFGKLNSSGSEKEEKKLCNNANFIAKPIDLNNYLKNNFKTTVRLTEIKLNEGDKFPEVKSATLIRFNCPKQVFPQNEFVILKSKALIEKEGLQLDTPLLFNYKGVLGIGRAMGRL